jgi:small subunit ribosomal protein S10
MNKTQKEDTTEKQNTTESRIRIKIRAYDSKIIDIATKTIIDTAERNNAKVVGPVPLPTEVRKYSVNRASFVHKTAQEQYEMRTHLRLIDILGPTPKAVDALMNLNLPSGVDVEIKMM